MNIIIVVLASIAFHPVFFTNHDYYYRITGLDPLVYGATNGGLVEYNTATGAFRTLTNADGLPLNRLNCVGLDSSGAVWTGSENGLCLVASDLQRALVYPVDCLPCSRIHALLCRKDTVLCGTGNGVLRLETMGTADQFDDDVRLEIYDTEGLPSNNITALAANDRFWVGTDAGLARCTKDFAQIEAFTAVQGLLANDIKCVACRDTLVLVGTDYGLNRYHAGRFDTLFAGLAVRDIEFSGDTVMLGLDSLRQVGIYHDGALQVYNPGLPWLVRVNDLAKVGDRWLAGLGSTYEENFFGDGLGSITFASGTPTWSLHRDRSLPSNHISDICCADSGVFVALGARDNVSRGIGWLKNDGAWLHFTGDSALPSNHIHRCETAPDGKVWFAMNPISDQGRDTVLCFSFDPESGAWRSLPLEYLGMDRTDAVWDFKFDGAGNMYIEIGRPSNRLWVMDPALTVACPIEPIQPGFYDEIAVDTSGRIWRTIPEDPGGLVMTNTHKTLFETSDDGYYIYTTNDGLLSNNVRGCVTDEDDNLYIAAYDGLSIYDGQRFYGYEDYSDTEPLDVARDSSGRIWILNRSGIYRFDPFYKTIQGWSFAGLGISLEFIPTDSKEVIQIQGFTFDVRRSCFWIGGNNGLLKLELVQDDSLPLDSLIVYPNPAVKGRAVRIKNLPADASVSVYSISGRRLAKDLVPDPAFGEVMWRIPDGTPSGLYFALVRTGRAKRIAKFAIVR